MTKEEFELLQQDFLQSGKLLMNYLRDAGVSYSTYTYWRRKMVSDEQCKSPIAQKVRTMNENETLRQAVEAQQATIASLSEARKKDREDHRKEVDGWFKKTVELLKPLYKVLKAEVMKADYVQADETTTPVIDKVKHKAAKEYLWMVRAVMHYLDDGRILLDKGGVRDVDNIVEGTTWPRTKSAPSRSGAYVLYHIRAQELPLLRQPRGCGEHGRHLLAAGHMQGTWCQSKTLPERHHQGNAIYGQGITDGTVGDAATQVPKPS